MMSANEIHYPISIFMNFAGVSEEDATLFYNLATELSKRRAAVAAAESLVNKLEAKPRCCGSEWSNNAGSMYAHHSLHDACPEHGAADKDADRGLRSYIGRDESKQAAARVAIKTWGQWVDAKKELAERQRELDQMLADLKTAGAVQRRFRWG